MYIYTEASEDEAGGPKEETVSHARETLTRLKQVRLSSVSVSMHLT